MADELWYTFMITDILNQCEGLVIFENPLYCGNNRLKAIKTAREYAISHRLIDGAEVYGFQRENSILTVMRYRRTQFPKKELKIPRLIGVNYQNYF